MYVSKEANFLVCLDNKRKIVLGGVMLPNTKHLNLDAKQKDKIKQECVKLLSTSHYKFVETAKLVINKTDKTGFILPKRQFAPNCSNQDKLFKFGPAFHKFGPNSLKEMSDAQTEYLNTNIVCHAWASIHNGIIMSLVFFPNMEGEKNVNEKFVKYLSQANILMKKTGYFVSGSLVIDSNGELSFYRVLKNRMIGNVIYKNWTQKLILTKSLKSEKEFEKI